MSTGADQEFDTRLREYFGCERGAYSPVTWTEATDGQVTLTGLEKKIAIDFFGQENLALYRGNDTFLAEQGLDARRRFRLYPEGKEIFPKLKYPKPARSELRLYFNDDEFKVEVGRLWGLFVRDGDIWLCDFTPWWKEDVASGGNIKESEAVPLEPENDDYQEALNSASPVKIEKTDLRWKRDPKIAVKALNDSGFVCEWRPELETFPSKSTGKPFLEAHHFIPMKAQSAFPDSNLDTAENICILNPLAHRMLHYAPFEIIKPGLEKMIAKRQGLLERLQINEDYIYGIYGRT